MNSEERRAARRARRDAKKARNRAERIKNCTIENVASIERLYDAAKGASSGVAWKSSVQRYMVNVLPNVCKARKELISGADIRRGLVEFDIHERGKFRHISAVKFPERVMQKSISRNALAPAVWPTLAPGCTANIKGRGTDYAIARLKRQLARHYKQHGKEGYILLFDFADYFASIQDWAAYSVIEKAVNDERVLELVRDQIGYYGGRGLGLGSEPNQVIAVALPSPIDYMFERMNGVTASGRHMDDGYAISVDKSTLWYALDRVELECDRLGLELNRKKTRVVKLSRGFTFLKKRFFFTDTGRIVVRPCRSSISRHRRTLKRQAELVRRGIMTREQLERSHQSWRGSMLRLDAYETVMRMDALYKELLQG